MAVHAWRGEEDVAGKTMCFLQELLRDFHPRDFAIELWDGTLWAPEANQFRGFTWRINDPAELRIAVEAATEVALGEAYIHGDFEIDGDIEAVFPLAEYLANKDWNLREKVRLGGMLMDLPSHRQSHKHGLLDVHGAVHSKQRDRQVVSYHYDVSNEFYSLWLDRNMVYSCAYFQTPEQDLETAQAQKLDYICRKLRLKPGERLLDIGCGWGGLIIHAAREYGVRASGITLSQRQLEFAQQRIQREALGEKCSVRLMDYREVNDPPYDKIVSVGMVEHVGEAKLPEYFGHAFRLLLPGGVFLCHGIGRAGNRAKPESTFTDVYVFPDGELVPIHTTLKAAEDTGFEVRDVENQREHYALTLHHWLQRLQAHATEAQKLTDELKYRIWRLYLAGSAYYFRSGKLDLYQTLLVKNESGKSGLPLTRGDWY
jgi:cyclopropane-fatty-acyl-phospholipid synthase